MTHSRTGRTLDTNNVAKILLTKKAQGRTRKQGENDVSSIVFKKRTSAFEIGKMVFLMVENGIVHH